MNTHHAPRERSGQYQPRSGASQRVKEAQSVRQSTMPTKKGAPKKGCNY